MSFLRIRRSPFARCILATAVITVGLVRAAIACGPFFPNAVLGPRDRTVLAAPVADFRSEIDRLLAAENRQGPAWPFPQDIYSVIQRERPDRLFEATAEADTADLEKALSDLKVPPAQVAGLLTKHAAFRNALTEARKKAARRSYGAQRTDLLADAVSKLSVPGGLPPEFSHYGRGALAFHQGKLREARRAWRAVLALPEEDRHYRSVWAAFMIGRSLVDTDPKAAIAWLERTRDLARRGLADSLDLATTSLGWEGRAELNLANYRGAIELYLAHYRAGGHGAALSLRDTAAEAFEQGPEVLQSLAADPVARPVLSAYVVAQGGFFHVWPRDDGPTHAWLNAVEAAGADHFDGADRLAWAAYQAGDWDRARRWLRRADAASPATQWVSAKMLLRDGHLEEAANVLSRLVRNLPAVRDPGLTVVEASQYIRSSYEPQINPSPKRDVAGELAVLRMTRRQYVEALDLLLRHDYWTDAAYVAERVLEPDELITYVEERWPADLAAQWKPKYGGPSGGRGWPTWTSGWGESSAPDVSEAQLEAFPVPPEGGQGGSRGTRTAVRKIRFASRVATAHDIRWLLARRLVRLGRRREARPYFTPDLQKKLDTYIQGIRDGNNRRLSAAARGAALWEAARMARYWGMELMGSELEPDNAIHAGAFGRSIEKERKPPAPAPPETDRLAPRTADEKRRAGRHGVVPDRRYHYRYVAADHAWAAVYFMPDNSNATAKVLCEAGGWLKSRDPEAADRFYKALVRRCGRTDLGREADETRWFPKTFRPPPPP